MKKAYLIHGWDGSPNEPMHKWIKTKLEEKKFEIIAPEMPNPAEPKIKHWLDKIDEIACNLGDKDIFIGHSIGCQAVLRYVSTLKNKKVSTIILIAPWMYLDENTLKEEGEDTKRIAKPWMETPIEWDIIKQNCKEIIAIFSDNDPYVPFSNVDLLKKKLNARILILNKRGHFDSSSGIEELPEILEFVK